MHSFITYLRKLERILCSTMRFTVVLLSTLYYLRLKQFLLHVVLPYCGCNFIGVTLQKFYCSVWEDVMTSCPIWFVGCNVSKYVLYCKTQHDIKLMTPRVYENKYAKLHTILLGLTSLSSRVLYMYSFLLVSNDMTLYNKSI